MGIKKVVRPINKAKNDFVKWLEDNKAEDIEAYEGEKDEAWDYYRSVSAFIGESLYVVYFMMWEGKVTIDYKDEENRYPEMSIEDFYQLIR